MLRARRRPSQVPIAMERLGLVMGGWRGWGGGPLRPGSLTGAVLTAVCHVLYGERLGLLQDFVDPEAQRFIDAVTLMFHTTSPMLYLPPALLRHLNAKTWQDHVRAWDAIFTQGERSSCPPLPVSPKVPLRTRLHSAAPSHQCGDLLLGPTTQHGATKARKAFHI